MSSLARFLLLGTPLLVNGVRTASAEVLNIFLHLEGIPGESAIQDHKKWIAIESFSGSIAGAIGDGGAGGKPSHSDLMLTKRVDSASLPLILRCNTGDLIPSATLDFTRLVGTEVRFYQVRLADVRIRSISVSGAAGNDDRPREHITLSYQGIQVAYTEFAPDGHPLPDLFSWWNVPANVGGDSAVACVTATPALISGMVGTTNAISVAIPPLLTTTKEAAVMLISDDPSIASFVGGANPYHVANLVFVPTASAGPLEFSTSSTGDASLLLDALTLVQRDPEDVLIRNPSFEASGRPPWPGYLQPAPLEGWIGTGRYGVNFSRSGPFADNGDAPDQEFVAFLQDPGSSLSQTVSGLIAGEDYTLTFAANARSGNTPRLKVSFADRVLVDEDVTPVGGTNLYTLNTAVFKAPASEGVLRFEQTAAGDNTVLLDDVRLVRGVPPPSSVALAVTFAGTQGLRVSWPAAAVGVKLQSASTLGGIWQDSTAPVAAEGSENAVYVAPSGQAQYFRLQK